MESILCIFFSSTVNLYNVFVKPKLKPIYVLCYDFDNNHCQK